MGQFMFDDLSMDKMSGLGNDMWLLFSQGKNVSKEIHDMSKEAIDKKILIVGEQDSRRTLLLGFGCSVFVHASTALAVSQLWHPAEEIIEITLVEPVEEPPEPSPVVAVKPKPSPRPSVLVKAAVVNSPSPTPPPSVQPSPLGSRPIEVVKKNTPIPTPPEQVVTRTWQEDKKKPITADNGSSSSFMGAMNQGSLAASTTQSNRAALNPRPDQQSGKENSSGTPAGSNQSGIGNRGSWSNSIGSTIAGAGSGLSPGEESSTGNSGEPGNIASIAGSSTGGTPAGSNQSGIGNSGSRSNSIGAIIAGAGSGLSPGEEFSTGSSGEPGNIASITGTGNGGTPAGSNQSGIGNSGSRSNSIGATIAGAGSGLSPGDDAFSDGSHSPGRGENIASGGNSDLAGNNQGGLDAGRSRASSLADSLSAVGNRDGLDSDNLASSAPGDTSKIAGSSIAPENSGKPPPRCIKNCTITDIKIGASDSGKDKIIIKAKIDGNGIVLAANIHRSSGNSDLDRLILKATQKMEFSPTGITGVYNIKHNLHSSVD
jgi:TonB family protein